MTRSQKFALHGAALASYILSFLVLAFVVQIQWNFFAPALKGHMTFGQAMNLVAMAMMLVTGIEIPSLLYKFVLAKALQKSGEKGQ